ncbi:MAG: AlpA family phage regulatory protein [Rhodoferax sp.]|jgi:prophage regulatory protein|uniref:helix-turn-helix transcriptional regulator n=1 Tax=Rhodoferax sp. TaxID=50421 RepID=UPI001B6CB12E|nr:AlpA family phage regulatory protein [Rhodoferax sp.]MBP8286562.1 AlpA family phage regulatory protein [Rhodoferax sp.]MBP9149204.1 AlpA family phage regulatory protein [Rhodoferax sp.]MBP9736155.1 AlpA family phage regulatory protein [Rhodoferax sp.]
MTHKRWINKKVLHIMVPLSPRTIDKLEKAKKFPARFAITSRNVVWDEDDVLAWMAEQKTAGHQAVRPGLTPA